MKTFESPAWVTGANGLIGNYLVQTATQFAPGKKIRALTRNDFDLLDFAAAEREFKKDKPRLIIHCAAISSVADGQKNPELTRRVNVEATKFLAELASEIQFIFFSTDSIFDGRKGNYSETDAGNPLNLYGETKLAAEKIVAKNPKHLIVRTSLNGGVSRGGRGFNEQLRAALRGGARMKFFTDEFRCPIFAGETARAVWELAEKNCAGIFHVAGAEKLSRWQIAERLVKRWPEITAPLEAGSAKNFSGTPRGLDTSMDISKAQKMLSRPLPGLTEWLAANPTENF